MYIVCCIYTILSYTVGIVKIYICYTLYSYIPYTVLYTILTYTYANTYTSPLTHTLLYAHTL